MFETSFASGDRFAIFYHSEEISLPVGNAFWPHFGAFPNHLFVCNNAQKLPLLTRTLTSVRVVKAIPESCSNFAVKKFIARGPFDNGSFATHYSPLEFPSLQPSTDRRKCPKYRASRHGPNVLNFLFFSFSRSRGDLHLRDHPRKELYQGSAASFNSDSCNDVLHPALREISEARMIHERWK